LLNSSAPHAAQVYRPARLSSSSSPVHGRSVAASRSTAYCSLVSSSRHSSLVLVTGVLSTGWFIVLLTDNACLLSNPFPGSGVPVLRSGWATPEHRVLAPSDAPRAKRKRVAHALGWRHGPRADTRTSSGGGYG